MPLVFVNTKSHNKLEDLNIKLEGKDQQITIKLDHLVSGCKA